MSYVEIDGFIEDGLDVSVYQEGEKEKDKKAPIKLCYIATDLTVKEVDGYFVREGYGYYDVDKKPADMVSKFVNAELHKDYMLSALEILKELIKKGWVKNDCYGAEKTLRDWGAGSFIWLKNNYGYVGDFWCKKNNNSYHIITAKDGVGEIRGIPSKYKGLVIGKGGRNIKELAKKLNLKYIKII